MRLSEVSFWPALEAGEFEEEAAYEMRARRRRSWGRQGEERLV